MLDYDGLFRRLGEFHVKRDRGGQVRVTSAAFTYSSMPLTDLSFDLQKLTTVEESLAHANKPNWGMGLIYAKQLRTKRFVVEHTPVITPGEEWYPHASARGENSMTLCDQLAEGTQILKLPLGMRP